MGLSQKNNSNNNKNLQKHSFRNKKKESYIVTYNLLNINL